MILVFDTETTGLTLHPRAPVEKQPRMIEFGGVLMNPRTGEVEEEISMLCNPRIQITPEITKITGLTDADVKDAPTFPALEPQLRRVFGEASTVVAHNLPFDRQIMRCELMRHHITDFPWPAREICTVQLHQEQWGYNPRLIELYEAVMGEPLAQTHRALDDVLALARIIQTAELWKVFQ